MLEKGFIRSQKNKSTKRQQLTLTVSNVLLYLGVLVLVGSFGYLLINWGKTDALVSMMMPFLVAGLGLVFVSYLIKRGFSKLR